jgi:multisubunit Na+/H+ antiporter MnhE subunit
MIVVHATEMAIRTEPGTVVLDLEDRTAGMSVRGVYTPDQAEKLAAELLMAAEKARNSLVMEIA